MTSTVIGPPWRIARPFEFVDSMGAPAGAFVVCLYCRGGPMRDVLLVLNIGAVD